MSDNLGRLRYSDNEEEIFLGRSITRTRNISEDTARLIDAEVRRIVEEAETRARSVLTEHMEALHHVSSALLEYESLSGDEVHRVLRGEPIDRSDYNDSDAERPAPPRRSSVPTGGVSTRRPGQSGLSGGLQPGN